MDTRLKPGITIRVTDEAFKCPKKRGKIVGRTRFHEHLLQDGKIRLISVHDDGQIDIGHPEVIGSMKKPSKIHGKFFEPASNETCTN